MEASVFGTPAPEQAAPAPAPQPAAPEPTQPAPAPEPQQTTPPPAPEQQPAEPQDPIMAELKAIREQIDSGGQQPPEPEPAVSLLEALEAEPEPQPAPEQPIAQQPPAQPQAQPQYDPETQRNVEELERFVQSQAQQMITPFIQEQREEQINALGQKYPDITDPKILPSIEGHVADLIQRTGDESLRFDAKLVEKVYRMVKAEQAEANAVPAEQVATNGASIETNAGSPQTGAPSNDEQYKSAVYGQTATPSVFGGG